MNNKKHTQHNRLASGQTKLRKDTLTIQPLTIHVFLLLLTLHSELQRKLSIKGVSFGYPEQVGTFGALQGSSLKSN